MKTKPEKRHIPQTKIEKRNKKLYKGDIDSLLVIDLEAFKKKSIQNISTKYQSSNSNSNSNFDANTSKKGTNINIFTEGLSYEKIDHNKYNKALSNLNNLFTKDLNKANQTKEGQKEKTGQIAKKYLYDRALHKGIEIEIRIKKEKSINDNKSIDEIISLLNSFFIDNNNFVYYEYSNSRNISFNKLSEGDILSYRFFYRNYDNINIDSNLYNSKEEYIKQLDYVNTLNNLFIKYNTDKKLFYIITPLYSYSFDFNKDIPLLLTSSKSMEAQLKNIEIKTIKITKKAKKDKNHKNTTYKSVNKNTNENNDKSDINDDEEEELDNNNSEVIGISKLYIGLMYNFFVNQNILKPFNIFSNFEFEGCLFRKCKAQIKKLKKQNDNNDEIIVKVEGIIFEEKIIEIIDFFKKIGVNNYYIRLNKIKSTINFYKENKEIETSFEKFEFKDDNFYFYKQ